VHSKNWSKVTPDKLQLLSGLYQEFKDSLTDKKVYVYVDNFENRKMSIVYQDSLLLFLNLSDSLETDNLFNLLQEKIVAEATQED